MRAFNPWPVAEGQVGGETLRVWSAMPIDTASRAAPGSIVAANRNGLDIACGDGALRLLEVQRAGGRRISIADYLNARPDLTRRE